MAMAFRMSVLCLSFLAAFDDSATIAWFNVKPPFWVSCHIVNSLEPDHRLNLAGYSFLRDAQELGLTLATDVPADTDQDGTIDALDLDSDNDGKTDKEEFGKDKDVDGKPDHLDSKMETQVILIAYNSLVSLFTLGLGFVLSADPLLFYIQWF